MGNLFKPASFLLYFLALIVFCILGLFVAKYTGAGEGQGLAGGAIVLFYGVVSGGLALIFSIVLAYGAELKIIIKLNKVLGVLFLVLGVLLFLMVKVNEAEKSKQMIIPPKTEVPE